MTFHDELHQDFEEQAYQAYKTLFLWLDTIAPLPAASTASYLNSLRSMAEELSWPKEETTYHD